MSYTNDFDIFDAFKTVLSYYIAISQQYYFARGLCRWHLCQTININIKKLLSAGCYVTREITRAMSHANTGHSKEMVQNYICGNILAYTYQNLKQRPILELLGQIKDFTAFSNHFKSPKGLKIWKYQKS